ncbi:hypothetical protein [Alcanivorax sp. 24]|uniref:hypothetical protein n=1 Tax=Alcanivorax sp. 24 TaxID=2545266 RepID=UPI00105F72FF|nr:hypothetical protein [Alcanivorax sp. 24]
MAKENFYLIFSLLALTSVSCASETVPSREEYGCLSGDLITKELKTDGEVSGQLKVSNACLNHDPDSKTPGQTMPGSINMVFCLPGLAPCGQASQEQKIYLNVVLPKMNFATSLVKGTKEKDRLIGQEGGLDFYQNEQTGVISRIPSNGDIYSVSCWGSNNEICDSVGLTAHNIQYSARTYNPPESIDWQALHDNIRDFMETAANIKSPLHH